MAKLKINCEITDETTRAWYELLGENAVSYTSIDEFISGMDAEDNKIDIEIHSCGGNCLEGWAIYDRLRTSGKEISVDIVGMCASMATVIALAAPIERRRMCKHAQMLIHKPYYAAGCFGYTDMDADTLQRYADDLNNETEKILDVYVERTGKSRDELRAQMEKKVEFFGFDRAKELGFVSEIVPEISACAKGAKPKSENNMSKPSVAEAFRMVGQALGLASAEDDPVNMVITSTTGEELTIERDGGDPEVGDTASPDGTFTTEDGTTYTVSGGKITSIEKEEPKKDPEGNEPDPAVDEEKEELKNKVAELEKQLAEKDAKVAELEASAKTDEEKEILETVNKAGGKEWLNDAASSHYVPSGRQTPIGTQNGADPTEGRAERHKAILRGLN